MAETLLTGVNEVLKRVGVITGDSTELTSFTDSGRQVWIDTAIQCWNEAIDDLYSNSGLARPNRFSEGTITLVAGTRAYALSDAQRVFWPFREDTNGWRIEEYTPGYQALVASQLVPANYTGRPLFGCIRPTDGYVYLDRIPQAGEAGLIFTYGYESDASLAATTDTMPFNDGVFRAMVPAVAALWERQQKRSMDSELYLSSIGRAARFLPRTPPRDSWLPARGRGFPPSFMNPFGSD